MPGIARQRGGDRRDPGEASDEATGAAPVPVRVSGDVGTADGWRFERCEAEDEPHGYVIEPSAVSLERYAAFLREASRRT